jgi:hypothetical protein
LNAHIQHKSVYKIIAYCDMNYIQSNKHKVFSKTTNKLVFNADDDMRYVMNDVINTMANGHYKLKAKYQITFFFFFFFNSYN